MERTLRTKVDGVSRCLLGPKGGVGAVTAGAVVLTNAPLNAIRLGSREWTGKRRTLPELAVIYENQVYRLAGLPPDFDLQRSVAVSFEPSKIRIYSFTKRSGCYYLRSSTRKPK